MMNILRQPDHIALSLQDEEGFGDAEVRVLPSDGGMYVSLTALKSRPRLIQLRWDSEIPADARILGDAWERAYGNLAWRGLEPDRCLPWYFLLRSGDKTVGCGVEVLPNAMVSWSVDNRGISAYLDVRCGGVGVELNGRELTVCKILCESYVGSAYEAAVAFCKKMSPAPLLPEQPIYGGNNWYYAYGHSSYEEIISDAGLQATLAEGLENRPFMVIDAGWQPNPCAGPWVPNEKYGDMKKVADAFKEMGVRPGIWVRFLRDERPELPVHWRLNKQRLSPDDPRVHRCYLDPSHPEVLDFIRQDVEKIVLDWGYQMIKHDFSEIDMFGAWGKNRNGVITNGDWAFYDRTKTSAEITKNFYKTILDSTHGKALILGCNCIGHLLSGLAHLNRTGDDTSGVDWLRTRRMGVNTLAFRLCQNNIFFAADADCVGFIPGKIDWAKNRQWAELLAYSGSPLFISCANGNLDAEQMEFMKKLYKIASEGGVHTEPLDWEQNNIPARYKQGDREVEYDWYTDVCDLNGEML